MGKRGALVGRRLGVRVTGRRLVGRCGRGSQSGAVLPLDRRSRGRGRGAAALHRPERAHDRRDRPRGPLPEDRPPSDHRSRRVRPADLADPEPGGLAGGPASRQDLRRRSQSVRSIPTIQEATQGRAVLPARSSPDRGQDRDSRARKSRGSRARSWSAGHRRPGDLRRRPARPPDRSVHGQGRLEYPARPSADQGHRPRATISAELELSMANPRRSLRRRSRSAQSRAGCVHDRGSLAQDAQPGTCADEHRCRRPRPAMPRRRSEPRSGSSNTPTRSGSN